MRISGRLRQRPGPIIHPRRTLASPNPAQPGRKFAAERAARFANRETIGWITAARGQPGPCGGNPETITFPLSLCAVL